MFGFFLCKKQWIFLKMSDYFELMFECLPDLMAGLGATLLVAIASMSFAFIIGMVLALMGLSNSIYLRSIFNSF